MLMNPRRSGVGLILWCLLSFWVFFGCLELAEQVQVVPEVAAEDQRQDLDEESLVQLASGLKSGMPRLGTSSYVSVTAQVAESVFSLSLDTVHQLKRLMRHDSPSLPLYQQLSVYRI